MQNTSEVKYPLTNVQVAPDGIVVLVHFSPTVTTSILLDANTCDSIARLWIQQKQAHRNVLHLPNNERLA